MLLNYLWLLSLRSERDSLSYSLNAAFFLQESGQQLQQLISLLSELFPVWNVVGAFLVGMLGSGAYLMTIHFRFANHPVAERTRPYLNSPRAGIGFAVVGGLIAAVFQLPQSSQLSAIQAFVLGITWPTLVNQYSTGQGASLPEFTGETPVSAALTVAQRANAQTILVRESDQLTPVPIEQLSFTASFLPNLPLRDLPVVQAALRIASRFRNIREQASTGQKQDVYLMLRDSIAPRHEELTRAELETLGNSNVEHEQLTAIAFVDLRWNADDAQYVLAALDKQPSAFIAFHALDILQRMLPRFAPDQLDQIARVVEHVQVSPNGENARRRDRLLADIEAVLVRR